MSVHMKAVKPLIYASRRLAVGDEFEARGMQDARLLTAIGKAVAFAPEPPVIASAAPTFTAPKFREKIESAPVAADPVIDIVGQAEAAIVSVAAEVAAAAPAQAEPAEKPKRAYHRRDKTADAE